MNDITIPLHLISDLKIDYKNIVKIVNILSESEIRKLKNRKMIYDSNIYDNQIWILEKNLSFINDFFKKNKVKDKYNILKI